MQLNEKTTKRVGETIEPVEVIMDSVDTECVINSKAGFHSSRSPMAEVEQITKDLNQTEAFRYKPGRIDHPSFEDFPSNLLQKLHYRDLHAWMKDHIKLWTSVYRTLQS